MVNKKLAFIHAFTLLLNHSIIQPPLQLSSSSLTSWLSNPFSCSLGNLFNRLFTFLPTEKHTITQFTACFLNY